MGIERSRLVFTGTRVPEAELIGEPGMPDAVASRLLEELLGRVEPAGSGAAAGAANDAMGQPDRSDWWMTSYQHLLRRGVPWAKSLKRSWVLGFILRGFDENHSTDEERFILLGMSAGAKLLLVCHCEREQETVVRIISARKATKRGSAFYRGK